jgi:hypothetical protein
MSLEVDLVDTEARAQRVGELWLKLPAGAKGAMEEDEVFHGRSKVQEFLPGRQRTRARGCDRLTTRKRLRS